jgi:TonB-linked SusC/RagA family outer membrane protein
MNFKQFVCMPPGYIYKSLLIMKLTVILLITGFLQFGLAASGQRVSLNARNQTLEQVFKDIRSQTGFDFILDTKEINTANRVNVKLANATLEDALDQILKGSQLSYTIQEKAIIIRTKPPGLFDKLSTVISNIVRDLTIKGRVVDNEGKPLPNASIRVKGKSVVTNTNSEGEFEIKGVDEDAVLLVSYVGYKMLEIALKDAVMPLEIKLNVQTGELQEVKITYNTGYQELNKERSTGSFVQIDNELFNRRVSRNLLDRITDVTSGLVFNPFMNVANNRSGITIRGISTINANMQPLIVVDDFPYDGDIGNINPNDVLNVTVLKDAAAAAIWGVKAGNGVIVITTKRGKFNQKSSIQFNANVTVGQKPRIFDVPMMNSKQVIEYEKGLFNTGYYNDYDDLYPSFDYFPAVPKAIELMLAQRLNTISLTQLNEELAVLEQNDVRKDYDKYLNQNSINQQYATNFSGGSDNYNYYASVGYDKSRSTAVRDEDQRLSIRLNNTFRPIKSLEISGFVAYTQTSSNPNGYFMGLPNGSAGISPYSKLSDENGNHLAISQAGNNPRMAYTDTASYPALLDWGYRPLDELANANYAIKQMDSRLGLGVKYAILPYLNAEVKYQYQYSNTKQKQLYNEDTFFTRNLINQYMAGTPQNPVYPIPLGGILDLSHNALISNSLRGQLNFLKKINDHDINFIAGTEIRESNNDFDRTRKFGFNNNTNEFLPVDYLTQYLIRASGGGSQKTPYADGILGSINRFLSYYANGSYVYKDKYLFSASGRVDGSNFYGVKANQRIVPLWSVGFGYIVSKENFYTIDWLSYLKLRATYGYNGNTNNTAAAYSTINYGRNNYTNVQSASLQSPPNPQLRWERVKMLNLGVDFELGNRILSGTIEYYKKNGIDLIGPIATFPSSGVASYTGNNASLKGKGIDVTLNSTNINSSAVRWVTNFIFSYATDKVTDYNFKPTLASDFLSSDNIPVIGQPLYKLYSYKWGGLNPLNGAPRGILADTIAAFDMVTSKSLPADLLYSGRTTPNVFGSLRNTFSYHNFSLSFNITYKFGYYFRRNSISYGNILTGWGGHGDYDQRWKKSGDESFTDVPSVYYGSGNRDVMYLRSSVLIEKGDHIRLQDIRLSYDLNRVDKLSFIRNAQLFVYANNLGIIWRANNFNLDPDYRVIPPSRTVSIGVNMNF